LPEPFYFLKARFELNDGYAFSIWDSDISTNSLWERKILALDEYPPLSGAVYGAGRPGSIGIYCDEKPDGAHRLFFYENTLYRWRIEHPCLKTLPGYDEIGGSLKDAHRRGRNVLWRRVGFEKEPFGEFRVSNYLGTASITLPFWPNPIYFEIQSRKISYHEDYRNMVADVGRHCAQLLLDWETPTSFRLESDATKGSTGLLEKFFFLRHALANDLLEIHFENIANRPHAKLLKEDVWMPAGLANCPKFASHPLKYGRNWRPTDDEGVFQVSGLTPAEMLHERKYESYDTPPNRFIRFALNEFREVCEQVMERFRQEQGTAFREAADLRDKLDTVLAKPFFDDVGDLNRIPFENQTLQRRDGYRDILGAWLLLQNAAKLNWPGKDDFYDGTNRDAATLYEFWLYFVLREVLQKEMGMKEVRLDSGKNGPASPFRDDGINGINLRRGEESVSVYEWEAEDCPKVRVHLYYNRTFSRQIGPKLEAGVSVKSYRSDPKKPGSYSRIFRPDFTLVFFPATYAEQGRVKVAEDEKKAEEQNAIGFLHFDAKYRIEDLTEALGMDEEKNSENEKRRFLDDERDETKTRNTYRRGDLYKMHTYNDAIRRTAGSYVFYPGKGNEGKTEFCRYEEIVPGVGAFRMLPTRTSPDGKDSADAQTSRLVLKQFLEDVLRHHSNRFSRDFRIRHWTGTILGETAALYGRSPNPEIPIGMEPAADAGCLLGYVRPKDEKLFKSEKFFYFHAVERPGAKPVEFPIVQNTSNSSSRKEADKGQNVPAVKYFWGHNKRKTFSWICEVESIRLVHVSDICKITGRKRKDHGAEYYYLVRWVKEEKNNAPEVSVQGLADERSGKIRILPISKLFCRGPVLNCP
jgi:predicted component of viral defense system (DUF524 family)